MCKLCEEEEEKNKLKKDVYLYKKIIAKMAYKDILSVIHKYELKGLAIMFGWDSSIRVNGNLFTESDLNED